MLKTAPCMVLAALILTILPACRPPENKVEDEARVIYWFTIDSLRSDVIEMEYNGRPVMPALSNFIAKSVYFENTYSQSSYTKISVASMFTGAWPSRLGVKMSANRVFPGGVIHGYGLDFGFATLAEHLQEGGYATFTHQFNAQAREGDGILQGFQHQDVELNRPLIAKQLSAGDKVFVYEHILGVHAPYRPTDAAREALGIEKATTVDPVFMKWFWTPIDSEMGRELYSYYLAEARDTDRIFEEFVDFLKENNSWDDALVIVTADHGEEFLEHGLTQHSSQLYEEVIRVPLFVKFPKSNSLENFHGQRIWNRVRLIDLFPTLLEASGVEEIDSFDGKSLAPILQGEEADLLQRPVIAYLSNRKRIGDKDYFFEIEAVISGRYKAIKGYRVDDSQLPVDFSYSRGDIVEELYDLKADPYETTNLQSHEPALYDSLWETYEQFFLPTSGNDRADRLPESGNMRSPDIKERKRTEERLRALGYIE